MERLRNLQRLGLADHAVRVRILCEQAAVEQHPDGLHGVQRHAFRPLEDLRLQALGHTRNETREKLLHRLLGERLEIDRGEAALAGSPGRPLLEQLWSGERDHVERVAT